jgi:hypothetical protein
VEPVRRALPSTAQAWTPSSLLYPLLSVTIDPSPTHHVWPARYTCKAQQRPTSTTPPSVELLTAGATTTTPISLSLWLARHSNSPQFGCSCASRSLRCLSACHVIQRLCSGRLVYVGACVGFHQQRPQAGCSVTNLCLHPPTLEGRPAAGGGKGFLLFFPDESPLIDFMKTY